MKRFLLGTLLISCLVAHFICGVSWNNVGIGLVILAGMMLTIVILQFGGLEFWTIPPIIVCGAFGIAGVVILADAANQPLDIVLLVSLVAILLIFITSFAIRTEKKELEEVHAQTIETMNIVNTMQNELAEHSRGYFRDQRSKRDQELLNWANKQKSEDAK